jgi:hypothetical protein
MKGKVSIQHLVMLAAIAVMLVALAKLIANPAHIGSLGLIIVACVVVALGQLLIIRRRK